jgi:hypothetical protein
MAARFETIAYRAKDNGSLLTAVLSRIKQNERVRRRILATTGPFR